MVIISLELTRVNPDRNIFSINVEPTSSFFTLQRFGPSISLNFKLVTHVIQSYHSEDLMRTIMFIEWNEWHEWLKCVSNSKTRDIMTIFK